MTFDVDESCVLLVDFQDRLSPALVNGDVAVANARLLAEASLLLGVPVLATEHNPKGLGGTVHTLKALAQKTLTKTTFDATRDKEWRTFLPPERRSVVVAGAETHVCVLQTVIGLLRRGHPVRVVRDAVSSRTLDNYAAGLERALDYGAELVTTEMVLFEWLGHCGHPRFREVLQLIKARG